MKNAGIKIEKNHNNVAILRFLQIKKLKNKKEIYKSWSEHGTIRKVYNVFGFKDISVYVYIVRHGSTFHCLSCCILWFNAPIQMVV